MTRSDAARKAAETRRAKEQARRDEVRRNTFVVTNETEILATFNKLPPESTTLDGIIIELVEHLDGTAETGFEGMNLAVWNDGRLLATVTKDEHNRPLVTRFGKVVTHNIVAHVEVSKPEPRSPSAVMVQVVERARVEGTRALFASIKPEGPTPQP